MRKHIFITLGLLLIPQLAAAHPGHIAGFLHPFTGIDHLLTMLIVGMWAYQLKGRSTYLLPLSFLAFMMLGGVLNSVGMNVSATEKLILASLVLTGFLLVTRQKVSVVIGSLLVGISGLMHGYAHVTELQGPSLISYIGGFLLGTGILLALGIFAGAVIEKLPLGFLQRTKAKAQ